MSGCLQECVRAEYTNKRLVSSMNAPWDPKDNGTQVWKMPILQSYKTAQGGPLGEGQPFVDIA